MKFSFGIIAGLLASLLSSSCSTPSKAPEGGTEVTVSLPVVAYFVNRIGGDKVAVNTMVPQSASHDSYTPLPSQITALANSSAYLALGPLDFETTWRERLTSAAPNMHWMRLDHDIELIADEDGEHGEQDPHYWLSPRRTSQMAINIAVQLKTLLPENIKSIDSATAVVLSEVEDIAEQFEIIKGTQKGKAFLVYHPAMGYLASDYELRQLAIEHHGTTPSPRTYMETMEEARRSGVSVIFVQQGNDPARAEAAAKELGATIVKLSPESYNWNETMSTILEALK